MIQYFDYSIKNNIILIIFIYFIIYPSIFFIDYLYLHLIKKGIKKIYKIKKKLIIKQKFKNKKNE